MPRANFRFPRVPRKINLSRLAVLLALQKLATSAPLKSALFPLAATPRLLLAMIFQSALLRQPALHFRASPLAIA